MCCLDRRRLQGELVSKHTERKEKKRRTVCVHRSREVGTGGAGGCRSLAGSRVAAGLEGLSGSTLEQRHARVVSRDRVRRDVTLGGVRRLGGKEAATLLGIRHSRDRVVADGAQEVTTSGREEAWSG